MSIDKYCPGIDLTANFCKLPLTYCFQPIETPLIGYKCHINAGRSKPTTTAHNWLIIALHELHTISSKTSCTAVISRTLGAIISATNQNNLTNKIETDG